MLFTALLISAAPTLGALPQEPSPATAAAPVAQRKKSEPSMVA